MRGRFPHLAGPTLSADEEFRSWYRDWLRLSASPAGAYAFWKMIQEVDFRDVYPAVHVPTLVLYRTYRPDAREMYGDVARLIPDARLVELPGDDYMGLFLEEPAREIEAFLRDVPAHAERDAFSPPSSSRTSWARRSGSRNSGTRAGALVERHHELVRRSLTRYRGTEIDTAGDGFFATFDGPARAIRCAELSKRRSRSSA